MITATFIVFLNIFVFCEFNKVHSTDIKISPSIKTYWYYIWLYHFLFFWWSGGRCYSCKALRFRLIVFHFEKKCINHTYKDTTNYLNVIILRISYYHISNWSVHIPAEGGWLVRWRVANTHLANKELVGNEHTKNKHMYKAMVNNYTTAIYWVLTINSRLWLIKKEYAGQIRL
jgi:hypothetical protein